MRPPILLVAVILISAPGRAWSQTAPLALSLPQAVSLAWDRNPELEAVRTAVPAAQARVDRARADGRLWVSANLFLTTATMEGIFAGPPQVEPQMLMPVPQDDQAMGNLMLMYPLSTGGRVGAGVAEAGANLGAARAEVDAALLKVAYEVREAYWRVLLNQELLKVQEHNVAEQTERLRVDEASEAAGKIPHYYVLRSTADLAEARQAQTNAARDVETALLALKQVLGLDLGTPLSLTEALLYESPALPQTEELVHAAVRSRPERVAAEARVEAARRGVSLRRALYAPAVGATIMLQASQAADSGTDSGYLVGVLAAVPLGTGGARQAEVAEAEAMVRRAEADRAALELQIAREVRTALLDLAAADQNVKTAEAAMAAAEEGYRLALIRYRAGKAINLEPIDALAALVRAQTGVVEATFAERVALDAVARAVGTLPK